MAEESKNEAAESLTSTKTETKKIKKKGVLSRLWGALFRAQDDLEKRLQYISKEEASVLTKISRRSHRRRRMTRHLIIFSIFFEAIAVGYAIFTTRSLDLKWKMRALRVLPVFLLPALSASTYHVLGIFTRMLDQKDHKTLENLRAERQAKIDELKEKTNYYTTQQLIQRYDTDPAAKAAAATVLASKLGADSGLKVSLGDESNLIDPTGKSNDVEVARTSGLRNRKASLSKTSGTSVHPPEEGMLDHVGPEGPDISQQRQLVVEHHPQSGSSAQVGGWIAQLAALLVGEDPTQSYALICGNCHMHNGLARKEDFPYVIYYCPHCKALNRPKQTDERGSGSVTPSTMTSSSLVETEVVPSTVGSLGDTPSASGIPTVTAAVAEVSES